MSRALFPTTFFEIAEDKYGDKKPSFHLALGYRIKRRLQSLGSLFLNILE